MILIISTCKEELSEQEFIAPLVAFAKGAKVIHHAKVTQRQLASADKIIISGTALADFEYLERDWSWLKSCRIPVLGICAGAQVIAKEMGWKLVKQQRIGMQKVELVAKNRLLENDAQGYFLHSYDIKGGLVLAESDGVPAVMKVKDKPIFACVFHPEVMTDSIIRNFLERDLNK